MKPLEELSGPDKEMAVDISCALSVLITRLPAASPQFFAYITSEFSAQCGIPQNKAKYALKTLGQCLFQTDWAFEISKQGSNITTKFTPSDEQLGQKPDTFD